MPAGPAEVDLKRSLPVFVCLKTACLLTACLLTAPSCSPGPAATNAPATPAMDTAARRAMLDKYCVGCHNQRAKTGNLLLDKLDLAHLGPITPRSSEKVVRKLRAG